MLVNNGLEFKTSESQVLSVNSLNSESSLSASALQDATEKTQEYLVKPLSLHCNQHLFFLNTSCFSFTSYAL